MIQENSSSWSQGFWGSEHPQTAALRVKKDYVDKMIALKRENMDRVYEYLTGLLDKAKEELHHARSGSNDLRRAALRQHVDEIIAYLKGQALDVVAPGRYDDSASRRCAGPMCSTRFRDSSGGSNAYSTSGTTATSSRSTTRW